MNVRIVKWLGSNRNNFNLHHPVWGGIEAKRDSDAKSLLAIVESYHA